MSRHPVAVGALVQGIRYIGYVEHLSSIFSSDHREAATFVYFRMTPRNAVQSAYLENVSVVMVTFAGPVRL